MHIPAVGNGMTLVVAEVVGHTHLIAFVVHAEIEMASFGVEQTGESGENIMLLLEGILHHFLARLDRRKDERSLELDVFRLGAIMFAHTYFVIYIELFHYLLAYAIGY